MEQTDPDLTDAWRAVLDNIQPNQRAWLLACDPVTVHDELAIIAVPDEFTRTQVEGRLRAELEGALSGVFGRQIGLGTTINPALVAGSPEHEQRQAHADQQRAAQAQQEEQDGRVDHHGVEADSSTDRHGDKSTFDGLATVLQLPGASLDQPGPVLHPELPVLRDLEPR